MATNSDKKKNKNTDAAMRAKKQSFKKRKDCILKKSMELSVLCGIKVCTVIVDPNGKVETWPENKDDVMEIVNFYHQNSSDDGSEVAGKKKEVDLDLDHHRYRDRDHHEVVLDLQQHELDEAESWLEGLSETSVDEFLTEISAKIDAAGSKIDILKRISTTMLDDDDDECQVNEVVLDLQQHELDEAESWLEGLSETSVDEFLTEISAKIDAAGSKIDILKRISTTMLDDDDDECQVNEVVLDLEQHELDEAESWLEGLSETSVTEFLTEISAKIDAVGSKIDNLKRISTTTMLDDDGECQVNDHSRMFGAFAVSCDGEKAIGDHSINDPIPLNFLDPNMFDDQYVDAEQNFNDWFDRLVSWNDSGLDSDFWQ